MRIAAWAGALVMYLGGAAPAAAQRPPEDDVLSPDDWSELYDSPRTPPPASPPPAAAPSPPGAAPPGAATPGAAPAASAPPPQRLDGADAGLPAADRPTRPPPPPPGGPLTMDEIAVAPSRPRVTLNMFSDTSLRLDSHDPHRPAFQLSPLNFLLFGHSGKLVALSEFAFELGQNGEQVLIDVERLYVGWHSERFSIEAGRTHSELGYWNNAFHHGRWLQMTVERPRIIQFEDDAGILPIHTVGVATRWRLLTGERQVDLFVTVGNGRGHIADDIQVVTDDNAWKSVQLKIESKGFGARDLRFGVSGYYDRIAAQPVAIRPALPDQQIEEAIGNAYLAYRSSGLTAIAEAYEIVHRGGGSIWKTFDSFVLAAYRFGTLVPYATGEVRAGDVEHDPFFFPDPRLRPEGQLGRFVEGVAGLRWDLNSWSAIKLEYRATVPRDDFSPREQRGIIDWSFGL